MTVTTQNSTERAAQVAHPPVISKANLLFGKVHAAVFNFTQSGTASAGSIARLIDLPSGHITYLGNSLFKWSALGTARTLDLGWAAYRDQSGTVVVADPNGIHDGLDAAAAGNSQALHNALASGYKEFISSTGVTITAQVNDGTFVDADTIGGIIFFVKH